MELNEVTWADLVEGAGFIGLIIAAYYCIF